MSSAALQTAPHQPNINTASSSHRQYTPTQSPSREGYYGSRENAADSPSNPKRPSRRPSDNADYNSPDFRGQHSTEQMTSRAALASPVPVTAASPADYSPSTSSRRRHEPPVAPPRTSSTQHGTSGGSSSRRAARAEERARDSPRRAAEGSRAGSSRDADGSRSNYDDPSSRSRRPTTLQPMMQDTAPRPSSNREARNTITATTMPIRTHQTSTASSSKQPSREASEVLNRIVVSQPEVDLDREKERLDEAQPHPVPSSRDAEGVAPPPVVPTADHTGETRRSGRSRHDHSKREKSSKFGDYYLGNTIGEGEFGKVKLGWKQDGGVQVAIKLIRRDSVGNNPSRLAKIYREVAILRGISHPNIVRLHEMLETDRHIGIVLEYASGGELFDYILNHRYLKDNAARRLFAQLVSGVGYLHKKGIVHRDLKLENLLLDRNRNIIITDFGFANTFDSIDELTEEEELNLSDRDFVKRSGLDKTKANGTRKGDLMQTSCGSPCYAAPELVVSDSLYTGRKVDVWSCGVILYAMLAGYLPFDDDPANPEGDNINLLYKYIVNTPLTFPEYVTPHARDLLRRILVPNPRKRADLFEVARHSWLSEYAHVVEFITSSTTTPGEIQNTTVPAEEAESSGLARSASVREPSKSKAAATPGDLARKQGTVDAEAEAAQTKTHRDNKRRTVQVEYVAPTTQTQRGAEASGANGGKTRARSGSQGPVEVQGTDKPLPQDPPGAKDHAGSRRPGSSSRQHQAPPTRPARDSRAASDNAFMFSSGGRPATGGSMGSTGSKGLGGTRASYGQPLPPAVAGTNAHGRIQQPKGSSKNYVISNPVPHDQPDLEYGRPSISVPQKFAQVSGFDNQQEPHSPSQPQGHFSAHGEGKGHKRSNTIGDIGGKFFGRSGSIFGGRRKKLEAQEKPNKKYPPVSYSNTMLAGSGEPRASIDSRASRRSFSLGLGKKRSGSISGSQTSQEKPRRFSLIPGSFSRAIGIGKDYGTPPPGSSQQDLPIQDPPQVDEYGRYIEPQGRGNQDVQYTDGMYEQSPQRPGTQGTNSSPVQQRFGSSQRPNAIPAYLQQPQQQSSVLNTGSDSSVDNPQRRPHNAAPYQTGYDSDHYDGRRGSSRGKVLQKNKRFTDAYEGDDGGYGRPHDHAGSSGAAKRVMDFFRRRGKARGGES